MFKQVLKFFLFFKKYLLRLNIKNYYKLLKKFKIKLLIINNF